MVYMESVPLFYADTEMVKIMSNNTMYSRWDAPYHPLEWLADTIPTEKDRKEADVITI